MMKGGEEGDARETQGAKKSHEKRERKEGRCEYNLKNRYYTDESHKKNRRRKLSRRRLQRVLFPDILYIRKFIYKENKMYNIGQNR